MLTAYLLLSVVPSPSSLQRNAPSQYLLWGRVLACTFLSSLRLGQV